MPATMPDVWFVSPGDPATLSGGHIYNARVAQGLRAQGWTLNQIRLPDAFPFPKATDQTTTATQLARVPDTDLLVIDGLAFGAFSHEVLAGLSGKIVALVHHPLADESGLNTAQIANFMETERAALAYAEGVIVTSPHTQEALISRFAVPDTKISVAIPGVDRPTSQAVKAIPPLLLSVGSLTHRKGHDSLVQALARIADLNWQCVIVGNADRDPEAVTRIRDLIAEHKLEQRVTLAGERTNDELSRAYTEATAFVLATRHEGYGMVFSEAMVHGLPIVTCAAGAVPDTVPNCAGLLVPPDSPSEFAEALRDVLTNSETRAHLTAGSLSAGHALPTWNDTARIFGEKLQQVAAS